MSRLHLGQTHLNMSIIYIVQYLILGGKVQYQKTFILITFILYKPILAILFISDLNISLIFI